MLASLSDRSLPPRSLHRTPPAGRGCGGEEKGESDMAYIYCDACGVGFHSNVRSCPQCGGSITRSHDVGLAAQGRRRRAHARVGPLREDVETEVRESIYGWRSGTVGLCQKSEKQALVGSTGRPLQRASRVDAREDP